MEKFEIIQDFLNLAINNGAIEQRDEIFQRNQLLHFLGLNDWHEPAEHSPETNSLLLMDGLLAIARENEVLKSELDEEFYESALMNFLTPRPSDVERQFFEKYQRGPEQATDYFYGLAKQVNQVKSRDIAKNIAFIHPTKYGDMEITINLSKPEKDPKLIAAARSVKSSSYPACQLCVENEGFYGYGEKAARSNHRLVKLKLNGENWNFQYSPYAYYNEHSIVLNEKHQPMAIDHRCFSNLLAFLDQFPHYMIGSNADLPIVGGSILTHDHYQAGQHEFPMAKAGLRETIKFDQFPEITAGIVNWPMSVIRISSKNRNSIIQVADEILSKWRNYEDLSLGIQAIGADGTQHHTITPIARKRAGNYEMDLVLRDNNISHEFPDGIFHPHKELHHVKKENIGLIEVMGLAILPPRLKNELAEVEKFLLDLPNDIREMHRDWAESLRETGKFDKENIHEFVQQAVGEIFVKVLENAGVFKNDESGIMGIRNFIDFVNE